MRLLPSGRRAAALRKKITAAFLLGHASFSSLAQNLKCDAGKNLTLLASPVILMTLASICSASVISNPTNPQSKFEISFSPSVQGKPVTGRLLLMISRKSEPEVRLQAGWGLPMFGIDVNELHPGEMAIIDGSASGHPYPSLDKLPPGDYYVQALLNVYTQFRRSDGHVIWAHMDQWEGQAFNRSPGNLISKPEKMDLSGAYTKKIHLTEVLPAIEQPADTEWVKRIKIQSTLLSQFWGRPIYIGAVILLPRGYDSHSNVYFPVIYQQGHFSGEAALNFSSDEEFRETWQAKQLPRMIAVTFLHPTPYYDDSYAVNSANNGPYGDAIMTELIPYIEKHFRIIREPYARVLTGESTGGWAALALQLFNPEFFGGTWSFSPDPVDFRNYGLVDIYKDHNAFRLKQTSDDAKEEPFQWFSPLRYFIRSEHGQPLISVEDYNQYEAVVGSRGRSAAQLAAWEAAYGPVAEDGYPKPLWDKKTGRIDPAVANYMRDGGYDLRHYAATNWSKIGPHLVGKIHVSCGDMDNYYLNLGVYSLEEFFQGTDSPAYGGSFEYGRPLKGHSWRPVTNAKLMEIMAEHITRNAPAHVKVDWKYD